MITQEERGESGSQTLHVCVFISPSYFSVGQIPCPQEYITSEQAVIRMLVGR